MRIVETVNKVGFDKDNPISNVIVEVAAGPKKGEKLPRLKRSYSVPETTAELVENIGGEGNFAKFAEIICEDYSLAHIRAELVKMDQKTTTNDVAVEKLLKASSEFTLATILEATERNSATKQKAQKVDAIAELMALGLEPAEFQARVAALLKAA